MRKSQSSPVLQNLDENGQKEGTIKHKKVESFSHLISTDLSFMRENLPTTAPLAPKVVSIWKEFRDFAFQGSFIDLAVGIIVGGAFGKIVSSLVNDLIMPPIGWILSGVDFANLFILLKRGKKNSITKGSYKSLTQARDDGAVTINVGVFLNSVINFSVISVIIFVMVRTINQIKKKGKKRMLAKQCKHCFSKIDYRALKCPYCTSIQDVYNNAQDRMDHSTLEDDNEEKTEDPEKLKPTMKSKWVKPKHFIKKELSKSQISF